jgi:uncharacterized phosphosugar-binding protein
MAVKKYYDALQGVIAQIFETQRANIAAAARLACVAAMFDADLMLHNGAVQSSAMERMEGVAPHIFDRYGLAAGDVLIVVSTSGINAAPIEMALCARLAEIPVIGVASSAYFGEKSRHSSGQLLHQCVDILIDNCVPKGDAAVEVPGAGASMGPVSTAASSFAVQSVLLEAAGMLAAQGMAPPVWRSGNIEGGPAYNTALIDRYRHRVPHL